MAEAPKTAPAPTGHQAGDYDPFAHRNPEIFPHPTSDFETIAHLLKGSLGSGILAIPLATYYSGLWLGLVSTFVVGFILSFCVHILVKNAHTLYHRLQIPYMGYAEVVENTFLQGPEKLRKFAVPMRHLVNFFLIFDLLGCCCAYTLFVAKNMKQVIDFYTDKESHLSVRLYMVILIPFLLILANIRRLKHLAPLSMFANILVLLVMGFTLYYTFIDIPPVSSRPAFGNVKNLPLYFGIVIFALEGIGVVMPLENNMKTPQHFSCVLAIGMSIVVMCYAILGFFGYLKYGDKIQGSITLNLPQDEKLAQSTKVLISIAMYITYGIQFYVPFNIMWARYNEKWGKWNIWIEHSCRSVLCLITVVLAIAIPNLGAIMALCGALCLSFLGLILPSVVELIVCWYDPGLGKFKYRLFLNVFLIIFGLVGFVSGTYAAIVDMIESYE